MKLIWVLLFVVLLLGCTSEKVEEKPELSFAQGVEDIKEMNGSIPELQDYKQNLSYYKRTNDVTAIEDFIDIEIAWSNAKNNLQTGDESNTCSYYENLQRFQSNASLATQGMRNFIEDYPDIIDQTKVSYETIEDIEDNIEMIEGLIELSPEFLECE